MTRSASQISRFPVPELDSLPADIRERILAVQDKAGFIPNIFLALAHRPEEFRAFFAYHDALMEKPGGLSKGEREMIVVATSGLNNCLYCIVAHGAILRIREKSPRSRSKSPSITVTPKSVHDSAPCSISPRNWRQTPVKLH